MDERTRVAHAARPAPIGPLAGFLERFRRSAGVPASVGGDLEAELAALFVSLDRFDEEAAGIRRRAEVSAARVAAEAAQEADEIVADAGVRAGFERDDVLQSRLRATDAEVAAILARAEAEVKRVGEVGDERLPALVADVLSRAFGTGE